MASIAIRNLDDTLKSRLRIQAAMHGRSMEDEAGGILRSALSREPPSFDVAGVRTLNDREVAVYWRPMAVMLPFSFDIVAFCSTCWQSMQGSKR